MDQATIADQMKRYYGEQNAPWDTLAKYMSSIGQPTTGSNTQTSPYFQNQTANALAGIGGTLGIGQQLFGGSGGGLLSGGASVAPWALDAAGASVPLDAAALAGSSAIDFGGGAAASGGIGSWLSGLLPWIGSDRRLKEDTKEVGHLGDLPIHTFKYKGDPTERIGFMADEVEKRDPGAVMSTDLGFKAVNYHRAAAGALARARAA
jgi:hypothetical protein